MHCANMHSPFSFSDDYASAFQQQIRAFREELDMESKCEATVEDRISKLPDGVLRHILSFVPTKCSMRTSVLSTRWKDMWVRVPNLYLYDGEFSSPADFMEFVDRALLLRDSAVIQKFHLYIYNCHTEDLSRVGGWLKTAVRCNVVELDLYVVSDREEMLELPESLLTCQTLKALKLESDCIKIPTTWSLPKLKFLYLQFLYPDYESMDFVQFPALEHLSIFGSLGNSGFRFNISVPELKTLRISLDPGKDGESYNFLINAPKLEKLDVSEGLLSNYTFKDTNSIAEASIDITTLNNDTSEASANRATKFLAGISSAKCLTLSSPFSTACSMPDFENLTKLMLLRDGHWWTILSKFLERSPNLESFVIKFHESLHPNLEELVLRFTRLRRMNPDCVEMLYWSPPESVPKCLLSSLKTITIKGFKGKEFWGYRTEMELYKYLLESCLVLEKMTVYTPSFSHVTPEEFYNAFPESERGSRTVQVELIAKEFYAAEGFHCLGAKSIYTNV